MLPQPPDPLLYWFPIRLPIVGAVFDFRSTAACESLSLGGVDYPAYQLAVTQATAFTRLQTSGDVDGSGTTNYDPWTYGGYIWFEAGNLDYFQQATRYVLGIELAPLAAGGPPAMWFGVHDGFGGPLSVDDPATFLSLWRKEADGEWEMAAGQPADDPPPLGLLNGRLSLETLGLDLIKPDGELWPVQPAEGRTQFPLTWQAATTPGSTIEFDFRVRSDLESQWLDGGTELLVTRRYKFVESGFSNYVADVFGYLHTPIRYHDSLFRVARYEMEILEGESPYVEPDQKRWAPALFCYPICGTNEQAADFLPTHAVVVSAGAYQPFSNNPWGSRATISTWCNATGSWHQHMREAAGWRSWAQRVAVQTPTIQRGRAAVDTISARCGRVFPKQALWVVNPSEPGVPLYFYVELVDYRIM